jgi:hypothetical protein
MWGDWTILMIFAMASLEAMPYIAHLELELEQGNVGKAAAQDIGLSE